MQSAATRSIGIACINQIDRATATSTSNLHTARRWRHQSAAMNYNWGEPKKNSKLTAIMMYVALSSMSFAAAYR